MGVNLFAYFDPISFLKDLSFPLNSVILKPNLSIGQKGSD